MECKKCVICYKATKTKTVDIRLNIDKNTNLKENSVLNRQLMVVFLLREFFETPQDICVRFLKEYGSPCEWIYWCDSCSILVEKARLIFDQMVSLRKQFDGLQVELKTAIQLSEKEFSDVCRTQNGSRWGATEIIRECFTKHQNDLGDNDLEDSIMEIKTENVNYGEDIDDTDDVQDFKNDFADEDESSLFGMVDDVSSCAQEDTNTIDSESKNSVSELTTGTSIKRRSARLKRRYLSRGNRSKIISTKDVEDSSENLKTVREKTSCDLIESKNRKNIVFIRKHKFICERCSFSSKTKWGLKEHYLNVHGRLHFSCKNCNSKMVTKEDFRKHNKAHHTIPCPKCSDKTYATKEKLKLHYEKEHPNECSKKILPKRRRIAATEEESISCTKCGNRYAYIESLKAHCKKFHSDDYSEMFKLDDKDNTCKTCCKVFVTKRDLKSHVETEHPAQFKLLYYHKLYPCPHCPLRTTKTYLQTHINHHLNLRPHVCDLCGDSFTQIQYLKHHQKSKHYEQLGIDPFKCKHCGKMFRNPSFLRNHIKGNHLGQYTYHCSECSQGFHSPSALNLHLLRHKGEKPQLCEECGKSFVTPHLLKRHIRRSHRNERPFPCKQCTKTFCDSGRLKRHEQGVHSDGTKPHECKICHKRFPVRNYLYIHMRSHKKKGEVSEEEMEKETNVS